MKVNVQLAIILLFGSVLSCTPNQKKDVENKQLLGAGFGISGATLVVQKLDSARKYYSKSGRESIKREIPDDYS